ncbi:radical SAM-linked protein [Caloramator quimbayensis]|uniref:Radical SAM-linked protein n=1 Tax=Caloramator quimbayensis TaxID=1147123 RepID=A0A1T4XYF1_9CLOT|nr:TIGR03936 family radical SAM-associated protein [Caloramator quimbayensis]SKA94592.1 radical SAM-linked protein [Caloramator quimbayensis]
MERYLIKFSKKDSAKYISHLDTMRTLHRAVRRAHLPIAYSKGFNPHASISVASPLSLGIESSCEYADIEFEGVLEEKEIVESLNSVLPEGIKIIDALHIKEKMKPSMSLVEGAKYIVILKCDEGVELVENTINLILKDETIEKIKKTKSGEKLENIRPYIKDIVIKKYEGNSYELELLLSCGSRGNLSPNTVVELLYEKSDGKIYGHPDIKRNELYCIKNDKWIDLLSYFKGK